MSYIVIAVLVAILVRLWVSYNKQKEDNASSSEAYEIRTSLLKAEVQHEKSLVKMLKDRREKELETIENLQSKLGKYEEAEKLGISYSELIEREKENQLVKNLHEKTKAAIEKQNEEMFQEEKKLKSSRSSKKLSVGSSKNRGSSRNSSSSSSGYFYDDEHSSSAFSLGSSSSSSSSSSSDSYSGGGGGFGGGGSGGDW